MGLLDTKNREDWRTLTSLSIPVMTVRNRPLLWNGDMLPVGFVFPVIETESRRVRQLYEQNKIGVAVVIEPEPEPKKTKKRK
ncbi:MAG TPA: hypothetical protein VGN17_00460 [Bryobacteraceae bacterium]|jgi:hypothetical protein